jgi:RNA polymerase sigma factor (sigma-70 family)
MEHLAPSRLDLFGDLRRVMWPTPGGWVGVQTNDDDLEGRALRGDDRAWNELIRRHDRRVLLSVLSRGVPPEDARDIVQETWLRLDRQRRLAKLLELRLPGLAVVQASFLARSWRRGQGPALADLDDEEAPIQVSDGRASQEERVLHQQQVDRALGALGECSERSRSIFNAVYQDGLSAAEAADRFGISVQRVRQTLCEVRARLRTAVGEA